MSMFCNEFFFDIKDCVTDRERPEDTGIAAIVQPTKIIITTAGQDNLNLIIISISALHAL